jgi:hypothetical protein
MEVSGSLEALAVVHPRRNSRYSRIKSELEIRALWKNTVNTNPSVSYFKDLIARRFKAVVTKEFLLVK